MVQAKNKKQNKPRKPLRDVKKQGKKADLGEFRDQLDALGLKIIEVTADGNCFFRSLADQLDGDEEQHEKYRAMVIQYIKNHREDLEPFIEDEVKFEEYCETMEKDGTWAGHMELQAASIVTRTNICIHQLNTPRWYINNFSGNEVNMIHLSYHHGEHYNSVRLKEDPCEGPAKSITIKVDANISSHKPKIEANDSKKSSFDSVKLVMSSTRCNCVNKIEQVLREVAGDVDAAIEYFIAEKESDANCTEKSFFEVTKIEENENDYCGKNEEPSFSDPQTVRDKIQQNNKKVQKNKEFSRSSAKQQRAPPPLIKGAASKGKKGKKQIRRNEVLKKEAPNLSSRSLPDMGALCI